MSIEDLKTIEKINVRVSQQNKNTLRSQLVLVLNFSWLKNIQPAKQEITHIPMRNFDIKEQPLFNLRDITNGTGDHIYQKFWRDKFWFTR